ncbi:RagB/SusD family nutrient uptake outer membrane protein [Arenibacter echinorum]|uniref:Putative outer membrane starch-binding protein n=1 Tax=Arenibacter echinorum TaxID=440515 RepID=A0A327R3C3_9FLAO|nr:RagB/SusD family nutrient uptake outer membrane protein [Arenibacter echinorum]RAJ10243.1 putative outer membrane starch-binding protein [Arenibacter echinorum]
MYIKKNFLRLSVLVACTWLFSCADLEEDTSALLNTAGLTTESDFNAALSPIFARMALLFKEPHVNITGMGADDVTTWNGGNKAPFRLYDGFGYGNGEGEEATWLVDKSWDPYWDIIYASNTVIEGADISEGKPEVVTVAKATAMFTRALAYYNLVRIYGGVPLILDTNATGDENRATVLQMYTAIEADLLFAAANLPEPGAVSSIGMPSSAAAKTALSSLYLTWGGWPVKDSSKYTLAAKYSKEVIDLGYFELLDITELWKLENGNSRESIFSIQYSTSDLKPQEMPRGFAYHKAGGWSDVFAELGFYNRFPEGPRKKETFTEEIIIRANGTLVPLETVPWTDSETTQRFNPTYQKFLTSATGEGVPKLVSYRPIEIFRYAEVLLIYAEAQARIGATTASLDALNQVRRRAMGLPYLTPDSSVDLASASPDEIVEESGWELAGEFKRWFDLTRTEKVEEITLLRDPNEKVVLVGTPNKNHYMAPLPLKALEGTNLVQNPEGFVVQ